jgi:hypothetical protein
LGQVNLVWDLKGYIVDGFCIDQLDNFTPKPALGNKDSAYENILGFALREVTYDWLVGYWVTGMHEMTLSISSSHEGCVR